MTRPRRPGGRARVVGAPLAPDARRRLVAGLAVILFGLVFGLRFAVGNAGDAVGLLFVVPVLLVASEFGLVGGLLAAGVGLGLVGLWAELAGAHLGAWGYVSRGVAFAAAGVAAGHLIAQRRVLETESTRWFELSNDMLCTASLEGYLLRVNDAWERTLGWTRRELTERPYAEFVHPEDVPDTQAAAAALSEGPSEVVDFENRYRAKDGSWRWLLWSARSDGRCIYAAAKDISARKALEGDREALLARVEAMARTDELTGLPNRRAWTEELRRELARAQRQGSAVAVALLDLDDFKRFNDERGHPAGDQLLREVGASWRTAVRVTDFLARYGGEEFAVLLPACTETEAVAVIERLRQATPESQTFSAGLAHWKAGETADRLLERADAALYDAKRDGKDRWVIAAPR